MRRPSRLMSRRRTGDEPALAPVPSNVDSRSNEEIYGGRGRKGAPPPASSGTASRSNVDDGLSVRRPVEFDEVGHLGGGTRGSGIHPEAARSLRDFLQADARTRTADPFIGSACQAPATPRPSEGSPCMSLSSFRLL